MPSLRAALVPFSLVVAAACASKAPPEAQGPAAPPEVHCDSGTPVLRVTVNMDREFEIRSRPKKGGKSEHVTRLGRGTHDVPIRNDKSIEYYPEPRRVEVVVARVGPGGTPSTPVRSSSDVPMDAPLTMKVECVPPRP